MPKSTSLSVVSQTHERRQGSMLEALTEGVVVVGFNGALEQANSAARGILGVALDPSAEGPDWWGQFDARHPDGSDLVLDSPGAKVHRTGRDASGVPVSVRRGDGERRLLRLNYRLLRDEHARPEGMLISFRDVTDAEFERERLESSEARLRDALEVAGLSSWEWDVATDVVVVQQGLPGQLDRRVEQGRGIDTLLDAILPEDRGTIQRRLEALRTGANDHELVRYRYQPNDGETSWVETRMRAVRDASGALVRVCGTTQDITASYRAAAELAAARNFHELTIDSLVGEVAVLDADGVVRTVNRAWKRFACGDGGNVRRPGVGSNYLEVRDRATGDDDAAQAMAGLSALVEGTLDTFQLEYRCAGGNPDRWFVMRASRHRSAGPAQVVVQHTEVTERRRADEAAWVRARLLDEVDAAVIATDMTGNVTVWSAGAERMYGWTAEEAYGRPVGELCVEPVADRVPRDVAGLARLGQRWEGPFPARRKDGTTFPADVRGTPLLDQDGRVTGMLGVSVDITEQIRGERELRSARDYLRAVADSMAQGMCTLDEDGRTIYMNDAAHAMLGWSTEELMGGVFHDLVHFRHPDGTPYLPEDCPITRVRARGDHVRCSDDVFVRKDGTDLAVEYAASPFVTPEGIGGTVLLFSDITERRAREKAIQLDLEHLAWVGRINDAIEQDRLVLHGQPIVDLASGATVQHELLVRMLDPDGSAVSPGAFLPAAERYGLIREIDRWVVRQAAELSARGHAIELNISADSLGDPNFGSTVERELVLAGADCSLIVIELTETALLRDEDAGRRFIERVRALGCRLALDDFGTGYGGFTYLKRLAVDFLKIDIEFVRDLPHNAASQHVVHAVVNLAADFGQATVAEGVEDAETGNLLREIGVDYAQGYYFGRPGPVDTIFTSSRESTADRNRPGLPS